MTGPILLPPLAAEDASGCHGARLVGPRLPGRPRELGVTAIELMLVLGIVSLLATLIILTLGDAPEILQAKGAAEQIASAIRQARTHAVSYAATYEITFPGGNQYQITCVTYCDGGSPGDGPTPLVHEATVTPPGAPISFTTTGASNGGTVIVNPGPEQRSVSVTGAGLVQIAPP